MSMWPNGALDVIEVRGDGGAVPTGFDAVMCERLTLNIATMLALPIVGALHGERWPNHGRAAAPAGKPPRWSVSWV